MAQVWEPNYKSCLYPVNSKKGNNFARLVKRKSDGTNNTVDKPAASKRIRQIRSRYVANKNWQMDESMTVSSRN